MTPSANDPTLSSTMQLIQQLQAEGIRVSLKGENLRFRTAKGASLSDETKRALRIHKNNLVALLQEQAQEVRQAENIPVAPRKGGLPLSYSQQQLWFLEQLNQEQSAYHIPVTFRLKGDVHLGLLKRAFQQMTDRHEILRTGYPEHKGAPYATVRNRVNIELNYEDMQGKVADAQTLTAEMLQRPFDLSYPPLMHASVFQVDVDEFIVVIVLHHLIADGWSLTVMFRELAEIYTALAEKRTADLPELPIQFIDYAIWQRAQDDKGAFDADLAYWQKSLEGMPPILDLPTDYQRLQNFSFEGHSLYFRFADEVSANIMAFARQENVTLFMFLQAAIQVLLYRYSQQTDFAIGSPVANRDRAEIEHLLGDFMNPLALRVQIEPTRSFRDHLQQVRRNTLEAMSHRAMPFDKLVKHSNLKRQAGYNPIYQVLFALQNAGSLEAQFGETAAILEDVMPETAMMDLFFEMWSSDEDGIGGLLEYSTNLFSLETIEQMAQHLERIAAAVIDAPETALSAIDFVTEAERQTILVDWNDTEIDYDNTPTHDLISRQAAQIPDKIAVRFADQALTYAELDEQSNRFARYLQSKGVAPDTLVGIMMNRSAEMMIALVGIWKAGGAYVPLDPTYPAGRLTYMVEDSGLPVLVTEGALLARMGELQPEIVLWEEMGGALADLPATPLNLPLDPEQRSYVIYTSGSTGRPKGVQVPHRALTNFLWSMQKEPGVTADDVLLSVTTLSFDIHTLELWTPLITGAELVVCDSETAVDSFALATLIEQRDVTVMQATPATWKLLIDGEWGGRADLKVLCGGEPLPYHLARQLNGLSAELWNMYGPTETTVWSSISQVKPGFETITIGRPIANTQMYILNEHLQPVPAGVVGELWIGGDGVTHGYWGRPELTAEKFIDSPFGDGIIYNTGDLARYTSDGEVICLGRVDHQVKVRGFRIELGEIETAVTSFAGIQDAVVIVREDSQDDKRIVAYFIADEAIDAAELHSHVANHLPYYMIPSFFMEMAAFPLTPNGKIDRKVLPVPDYGIGGRQEYVAPRNETEERVAQIWADVLQAEQIGVHDSFFDLGGHSLLITRVINRIANEFGSRLSLMIFFDTPTVAAIAEHLESESTEVMPEIEPIPVVSRGGRLPLSYSQKQLWFLEQINPGHSAYHIPITFRLNGDVDWKIFERALQRLASRHEILRTGYPSTDGEPYAAVEAAVKIKLNFNDVRGEEVDPQALTSALMRQPFNLAQPPLMHHEVYQTADDQFLVVLVLHHLIIDGWSMVVLVQELAEIYTALAERRGDTLDDLPIQFIDYAAWQRAEDEAGRFDDDLAYWQEALAGIPPILDLPTDYQRPQNFSFEGDSFYFAFGDGLSQQVNEFIRRENVTLYMFLQAAVQVLLYRYSQQLDFAIGSPVANRDRAEIESLLGDFMNPVALRAQIDPEQSFHDHLQAVKVNTLDVLNHRAMPFDKLITQTNIERQAGYNPVYQVLFALQNVGDIEASFAGVSVELEKIRIETAMMDLFFEMWEENGALGGRLEYSTTLFSPDTVHRMAAHLEKIVAGAVADPAVPLSALDLTTEAERVQLLEDWNRTGTMYDNVPTPNLIQKQAARTPEKIAVRFKDNAISYQDLEARSNSLAHYLQAQGVVNDTLVGVMMDRSAEMMVALIGVWKAGGAYVPLDPTYPDSRLAHMINDSGLPLIITEQKFMDGVPGGNHVRPLAWEDLQVTLVDYPTSPLNLPLNPEERAYVIYTSGSTGLPKGVQIPHRALTNFLWSMQKEPAVAPDDVLLSVTTLSFDIHTLELWTPLITGAELVVCDAETAVDSDALAQLLEQRNVSIMQATPATWKLLIDGGWDGRGSLKMLCGGEPLPYLLATQLLARGGELWNMYGPTETTVWSTISQIMPAFEKITIGRPIANTTIYILNEHLQPVPVGLVGELWIGGDGVTHGYLNRDELTAEKFIPNPFGEGIIYNTGDLARYTGAGEIICLGRSDNQVKVRGYRIELGEIEVNLTKYPDVKDGVVVVREDTPEDKRIVAYYISDEPIEAGTLYDYLHDRLPYYMVPTNFMRLDEFPLTPNGKINRRALPVPNYGDEAQETEFVAPRDELETDLVQLWESVLKVKDIGINDNFFHLGGHSLTALRLFSGIDKLTARKLPLATLFEAPTIAQLADRIRNQEVKPKWSAIVPIKPEGHGRPFFYVSPYDISVLEMRSVANHFGENRPFYGIQPYGLSEGETPHNMIADMAAHYIEAMKDMVPNGPYFIGGHCAGAWVAYEMAHQLQQAGDEVGYLGLVDNMAPNYEPPKQSRFSYIVNRAAYYMSDRRLFNALAWQVKMQTERRLLMRVGSPTVQRIQAVRLAHDEAFDNYTPPTGYTGPMSVVVSSDNLAQNDDELWYKKWGELTKQTVEYVSINSTHAQLLVEPYVSELSDVLVKGLMKAEKELLL